MTVTEALESEQ